MTVHRFSERALCLELSKEECPNFEDFNLKRAKYLAHQGFQAMGDALEVEGYWFEQGALLFARTCPEGIDFPTLFRREILTGCGILIVDAE